MPPCSDGAVERWSLRSGLLVEARSRGERKESIQRPAVGATVFSTRGRISSRRQARLPWPHASSFSRMTGASLHGRPRRWWTTLAEWIQLNTTPCLLLPPTFKAEAEDGNGTTPSPGARASLAHEIPEPPRSPWTTYRHPAVSLLLLHFIPKSIAPRGDAPSGRRQSGKGRRS